MAQASWLSAFIPTRLWPGEKKAGTQRQHELWCRPAWNTVVNHYGAFNPARRVADSAAVATALLASVSLRARRSGIVMSTVSRKNVAPPRRGHLICYWKEVGERCKH